MAAWGMGKLASPKAVPGWFLWPVPSAKKRRAGSCLKRVAAVSVNRVPQAGTVEELAFCPFMLMFGWLQVMFHASGSFSRSKNRRPAWMSDAELIATVCLVYRTEGALCIH